MLTGFSRYIPHVLGSIASGIALLILGWIGTEARAHLEDTRNLIVAVGQIKAEQQDMKTDLATIKNELLRKALAGRN